MEMKSRNTILLIIVVVIAVGVTAWQFGYWSGSNKSVQTYKDEVKTRLAGTGMFMPEGTEVKQLSGTIKSINGGTIGVVLSYPKDFFSDSSLDERNITIDGSTVITVMVGKDNPVPPEIFDKKTGGLSSIKVGQMINITTADDVRNLKDFTALTVDIWESKPVQILDL